MLHYPFDVYWKAGSYWLKLWNMQCEALGTIAMRTPILLAEQSKGPKAGSETTRMFVEKWAAMNESFISLAFSMPLLAAGSKSPAANAIAMLQVADRATRPFAKRVKSNRKRLGSRRK